VGDIADALRSQCVYFERRSRVRKRLHLEAEKDAQAAFTVLLNWQAVLKK